MKWDDLDHLQPGKLMLHDFLVFRLNDSIDKIIVPIKSYKMDWFIENNLYYDHQLDVEGSVPQLPQNTTLR